MAEFICGTKTCLSQSYHNPMNNGDIFWEPGFRVGETRGNFWEPGFRMGENRRESFASISAAFFELSGTPERVGAESPTPLWVRGLRHHLERRQAKVDTR